MADVIGFERKVYMFLAQEPVIGHETFDSQHPMFLRLGVYKTNPRDLSKIEHYCTIDVKKELKREQDIEFELLCIREWSEDDFLHLIIGSIWEQFPRGQIDLIKPGKFASMKFPYEMRETLENTYFR